MATAFPLPVTAAQVGTYFVGQYYQMLQNQPDFVHQFYSEASTMLRIDGNTRVTATAMLQIHNLVTSLNYTGIEIKTAHSLESWNGGVLVMVSGSVHVTDFNGRKKFVETFFLAPQEKGFFVLNNIFHYVDQEQNLQHPIGYLPRSNLESKLNYSTLLREQVPNHLFGGDIQLREYSAPLMLEEDGPVNNYSYHEEQNQQVSLTEKINSDNFEVQTNGALQGNLNSEHDHFTSPIEESIAEPEKHTYASIVAKGQPAPAVSQTSANKSAAPSEWQATSETPSQLSAVSSYPIAGSGIEIPEEPSTLEDEFEVKSVYVRNVPMTMAASEIAEEFRKFGKLSPDGVAIRTRKDIDICYAFVEFEDISGVQNAIKASQVQIGEHQLYIEGRKPNRNNSMRGGRGRGRGRVSYQMEGTRGRFGGRGFSRTGNPNGYDRDYKAIDFYRQAPRQERSYMGNQRGLRNGQNLSE